MMALNDSLVNDTQVKQVQFLIQTTTGCLSFLPNFVLLLALIRHRPLRRRNVYIIMSVSAFYDSLNCLSAVFAGIDRTMIAWNGQLETEITRAECMLKPHLIMWIFGEHSVGHVMMMISIDRLLSMTMPLRHGGFGRSYAYGLIGLVHVPIVAYIGGYNMIYMYMFTDYFSGLVSPACYTALVYPSYKVMSTIYYLLLVSSTLLYIPIVFKVRKKNKVAMQQQAKSAQQLMLAQQRKLTLSIALSSVVTFILFLVPLVVSNLPLSEYLLEFLGPIRSSCAHLAISADFMIYVARQKTIRKAVKYLFHCKELTEAQMNN